MRRRLLSPWSPDRLPDGVRAGRRAVPPLARAAYVRRMFGAIAPRYDRTNAIISAGLHRGWKRETAVALGLQPGDRALDLCCGTGDLARLMAGGAGPTGYVVGVDFAAPMIVEARRLASAAHDGAGGRARRVFLGGDAMSLPFAAGTFDAVAVGFGLRNVADPAVVLRDIRRVLHPGGRLAILEFARVTNPVIRLLYDLYSFTGLAVLGRLVSRHPDAYTYLPVSIRHWIDQEGTVQLLREQGFTGVGFRNLAAGIVAIYHARTP